MGNLQVESGDLIAYGLLPEFTGRLPILVSLSALNEDQLVQVCIFKFFLLLITTSKSDGWRTMSIKEIKKRRCTRVHLSQADLHHDFGRVGSVNHSQSLLWKTMPNSILNLLTPHLVMILVLVFGFNSFSWIMCNLFSLKVCLNLLLLVSFNQL